jgi:hypothetical protein
MYRYLGASYEKKHEKKLFFLHPEEKSRIDWSEVRIRPDPHQNVTDPQHWLKLL